MALTLFSETPYLKSFTGTTECYAISCTRLIRGFPWPMLAPKLDSFSLRPRIHLEQRLQILSGPPMQVPVLPATDLVGGIEAVAASSWCLAFDCLEIAWFSMV